MSKKPDDEEYYKTLKTTATGMVILGMIGLIISLVFGLIR